MEDVTGKQYRRAILQFLAEGWIIKRSSTRSSWTRAKAGSNGGWALVDHTTVHDMIRDGLLEYTSSNQLQVRRKDLTTQAKA